MGIQYPCRKRKGNGPDGWLFRPDAPAEMDSVLNPSKLRHTRIKDDSLISSNICVRCTLLIILFCHGNGWPPYMGDSSERLVS